eukprot:g40490.t1
MNAIYKFADNTTMVRWILNNEESEYRKEIEGLVSCCNDNNLFLNVGKTKELIIDFRKKGGAEVERGESVKFLRVTITNNLTWSSYVDAMFKKAQQRLFFLKQLRKFSMSIRTLTNFYRCTI